MLSVRLLGHLRGIRPTCSILRKVSTKQQDLYTILGVKFSAEQKEIKDNFYKLSKEHHPDLNKDDESSLLKFKEIAVAYETLSNPERRKEYDLTMGFGRKRDDRPWGRRRKFTGMKGVFKDGRFVDDDEPPQMRNIEYDLSPERMENLWARYKARWERVEEVERLRELEKKKVEFRRRVDLKREKMKHMSVEEKEEFLFKLRLLRPDAAEEENTEMKEERRSSDTERRRRLENEEEEAEIIREKQEKERIRLKKEKERAEEIELARLTREVMINQFGMTEKSYEEMMERNNIQNMGRKTGADSNPSHSDPLYEGLDSSRDAADWRSFMGRSIKGNKEQWERVREAREDSASNISHKHGVDKKWEKKFDSYLFGGVLLSAFVLLGVEFRHRNNLDE